MSLMHEVISVPLPEGDYATALRIQTFRLVAEDCGGSVRGSDCVPVDRVVVFRIDFEMGEIPPAFTTLMRVTNATRVMPKPA